MNSKQWVEYQCYAGEGVEDDVIYFMYYDFCIPGEGLTTWFRARVKFDGCIDFTRGFNSPLDMENRDDSMDDNMHICDIDEMIDILQKLKAKAIEDFKCWPR